MACRCHPGPGALPPTSGPVWPSCAPATCLIWIRAGRAWPPLGCVRGPFRARGLGWSPAQVLPFLAGFGWQRNEAKAGWDREFDLEHRVERGGLKERDEMILNLCVGEKVGLKEEMDRNTDRYCAARARLEWPATRREAARREAARGEAT